MIFLKQHFYVYVDFEINFFYFILPHIHYEVLELDMLDYLSFTTSFYRNIVIGRFYFHYFHFFLHSI